MIFWPIRPPKLFRDRHIRTIIINRAQSIQNILQKNFIIMRVSVKFFPNFIAVIARLELYCQNSGQLKFKPFIRKNMYRLQNMRRKIIFFWIWTSARGRAFFEKFPPNGLLIANITHDFIVSLLCDIDGQQFWIISQKIHERRSLHSRALKLHKKQHFSIFSPFWKFWKISTRWDKYIWIEEYNLSNNFFEKFAKI